MISIEKLIEMARKYVGVKYQHQGRSVDKGVDCIGLLILCAQETGIKVKDDTTYSINVDSKKLSSALADHCEKDLTPTLTPGRIALMSFNKKDEPTHTALITDRGILHSTNSRGCVVEHRINDMWGKRIVATYKIIGVNYEHR